VRIIKKGGGRKVKLSIEEQILLTLIYLRHLTTFQLLGIQFEVSESTNDTFKLVATAPRTLAVKFTRTG